MSTVLARLPAILAALAVIIGALSSPEVLAVLPGPVAAAITVIGGIIAALTRPIAGPAAAPPRDQAPTMRFDGR